MKKDAYYFPHFIGARNDRKIKRVRRDLGAEGYALYFMALEVLREEEALAYPIDDLDILAEDFGTSEAKLKSLVLNYNLFDIKQTNDGHMFFSPKQIEYLQPYLEKREHNRLKGIKSGIARRQKAEQLILDLSVVRSTKPQFNYSSTTVEQINKEINKEIKKELSIKRDIFKNIQTFKTHFIDKNTNVHFYTQGVGYEVSTPFKINESGYVVNMVSGKMLTPDEALKIWEYLFSFYQNQQKGA